MVVCPICNSGLQADEGLVIRPIDNGTTDVMRILHVKYDRGYGGGRILHESDNYTRLVMEGSVST